MDTFNQFFGTSKTAEPHELNDELDDLPLPEGSEMPDIGIIQDTIKAVDELEKGAASATTPRAPTLPRVNTDVSTIEEAGNSSPTGDMLSVTSEMNRNTHALQGLMTEMNVLKGQISILPALDARLAKLEKTLFEFSSRMTAFTETQANSQQSMSRFQSDMARKIADVERRAALPKAPVGFNTTASGEVPAHVEHTAKGSEGLQIEPTSKPANKVTVVDMSSW